MLYQVKYFKKYNKQKSALSRYVKQKSTLSRYVVFFLEFIYLTELLLFQT